MYFHEMAYLYPESYLKGAPDETLFDVQNELDTIETDDNIIAELKERVMRLAKGRRRRAENRLKIKGRRKEFAKSRDKLFIETGNRDGFVCCDCGAVQDLTLDHITPLIEGGMDELDNLQLLCRSCNSHKGVRYE